MIFQVVSGISVKREPALWPVRLDSLPGRKGRTKASRTNEFCPYIIKSLDKKNGRQKIRRFFRAPQRVSSPEGNI